MERLPSGTRVREMGAKTREGAQVGGGGEWGRSCMSKVFKTVLKFAAEATNPWQPTYNLFQIRCDDSLGTSGEEQSPYQRSNRL